MFKKRKANAGKIFSLLFVLVMVGWLGLVHFGNADLITWCDVSDNTTAPVKNVRLDDQYCHIGDAGVGTTAAYNYQQSAPVYDLQDDDILRCWGDEDITAFTEFIEDITFDRGVRFTLSGGYYDDFTLNPGDFSTIKGSMKFRMEP